MKLTNNVLCAVALVATSEAITMSGRAGIPADAMLQILNMELVAISRRCTSSRGGVEEPKMNYWWVNQNQTYRFEFPAVFCGLQNQSKTIEKITFMTTWSKSVRAI